MKQDILKKLGTACLHMALSMNALSAVGASSSYYRTRKGTYGSGKTHYISDPNLKPLSTTTFSNRTVGTRQLETRESGFHFKKGDRVKELVLVDHSVQNKQVFFKQARPGLEVVEIKPGKDGLGALVSILQEYSHLDAVHIVSHARSGALQVGGHVLDQKVLENNVAAFATINNAIREGGDLMLYGCEIGKGKEGEDFLEIIQNNTHVDIAASEDKTGNEIDGGNWELEIQKGDIEARPLPESIAMNDFTGTLQWSGTIEFSEVKACGDAYGGAGFDAEFWTSGNQEYALVVDGLNQGTDCYYHSGVAATHVDETSVTLRFSNGEVFDPQSISVRNWHSNAHTFNFTSDKGDSKSIFFGNDETKTVDLSDFANDISSLTISSDKVYVVLDDFEVTNLGGSSDTQAPIFQNSTPSVSGITTTGATLTVRLDEIGTAYYVVVPDGAGAPGSAQVKAGQDSGGGAAFKSGSINVSSASQDFNEVITGLNPGTSYDIYVVAEDDEGSPNLQASPTKVDITTAVALSSSPTLTFTSSSTSITTDDIASDGQGGALEISDIDIDVFNISDTNGTLHAFLDWKNNTFLTSNDGSLSGLTDPNTGSKGMSIKSSDGSEFKLIQFKYYNWGETSSFTNTIVGYRDGGQVATTTFDGYDSGYLPQIVTLSSAFSNVDEVRFYISAGGYEGSQAYTNHTINDIQVSSPVAVDTDATLTAAAGVVEPVSLSSTDDTVGEAVDVFDFTISDGGGGDGLATTVSQIEVNVSGTSTDVERSQITWRLNGPDASNVTGTYNAGTNKITFSGLSISVADGGNETYTINAYFNDNTGLTEDHTIILSVSGDTDLTVGGSGTQMASSQSAVTNGSGTTIDIVATQLVFTTQPAGSVSGIALTTQPVVSAQDAFGNTDVDFTETVTLTEASPGTLSNNTQAATNGVATFTNLVYTATADQESFTLTANDQDGVGSDLPTVSANAVTSDVVATKLLFTTQPVPTTVNSGATTNFSTVPVVSAVDANNTVDTGYSTGIVLSEVNGAGSATMSATGDTDGDGTTVTITPSSGVSTFTGMQITYTASGSSSETFNLRASSGGLITAESDQLTALVNDPPVFANLNGDNVAWSGIGNTVTLDSGGDATVSDTELDALNGGNGDYSGGSLTVQRSGGGVTSDVFGFDTSGALFTVSGANLQDGGQTFATFTNTNGVLTISFTSSGTTATTALASDVLQRITYRNDTPAGDATVRFTLSDGTGTDTADVTVTSDNIYITETTDTNTIDVTNGVSFSEAIAIAAADGTGTQTLILASSLAGQTVSATSATSLSESLTLDMDLASGVTISGGSLTLGGGVTLTLDNGSGDTATISTVFAGTGSLAKTGDGTITLTGSQTYSGTTTLTSGTLSVAADSNLGSGTVTLDGGTLQVTGSGVTVDNAVSFDNGGGTVSNANDITLSGLFSGSGTLTKTGTGQLTLSNSGNEASFSGNITVTAGTLYVEDDDFLSSGTITLDGGTLAAFGTLNTSDTIDNDLVLGTSGGTIGVSGGGGTYTLILSGVISGSGSLTKTLPSRLELSGANTYSGSTTIQTGQIIIASDSNLGSGNLIMSGGTLSVTGAGVTIDNNLNMSGSGTLNNANDISWSGVISGSGSLTKTGSGTLTLSGTQTHSGATIVSAGAISISGDSNLGSGTLTLNGGSLTVTGSGVTIDNAISLGAGHGTVTNANAVLLSGVISGSGNLTKAGAGTLTLSGTNTYSGSTALSAGQLTVSGSLAGAVTAATGTTLESAGTISGLVTINSGATLQTGGSPGTLTLGDGLTLNSGGTLVARINGTTAGSQYDQYNVTGTVTLGGTLSVTGSHTGSGGENFVIINNDSNDAVSGAFNGLMEGDESTTLNSIPLAVSYLGSTGNDVVLSVVGPEVTDGNISISGASGTGGAYRIGDTVTATWNNTGGGDNNADITGVTVDFSAFGGGAAVVASNSGNTWTATYTIVPGAIDGTDLNVSVTATNSNSISTTTADTSNATVDNVAPTVTDSNISISGATGTGGTFKIGDTVTVTWNNTAGGDNNSDVISSATADFSAFGGGAAVVASNSSGTWTATYTLVAGAIEGTNLNVSITATDNAGNSTTTADTSNATVDTLAPSVLSVTSSTADGSYKAGDLISVQVVFDQNITVTGTPQLELETGDNDRSVDYASGSGTSTLTFSYTVQAGDITSNLDYTGTGALSLNGGIIADDAGNTASLTLASPGAANSLGNNKALEIDGIPPTVTSVSVPANSTYVAGENLDFTVNFDENVMVNTGGGTPRISLTIGSTTRYADYLSGSGASAVVFRYTVQTGDLDSDGIALGAHVDANGGTLKDAPGNDATLTLNSVGSTASVFVDAVVPSISSVSVPANGTYVANDNLDFTVNFDDNVTVNTGGGTPRIPLTIGSTTGYAEYLSGSGTSAVAFRYTVQTGDLDSDGIAVGGSVDANGGTLKDASGNDATLTLNSVGSTALVFVDAVAPSISSVSVPANGTYVANDNLDFTVNFDDNVTVNTGGGTPRIALTIGSTTGYADYLSGSGTSAVAFRYTVQTGDLDIDGIAVGGSVDANGGTLRDASGNDASLMLNSVGSTASVLVDAVVPIVTDDNISISGATGTAGIFKIGDTVTATWNNTTGGDNNADIAGVTVDFSEFGGGAAVIASNSSGTWTATYTIVAGAIASTNLNISITVTDNAGNSTTTADTSNASVDNASPTIDGVSIDQDIINAGNQFALSFALDNAEIGVVVNYAITSDGGGTSVTGSANGTQPNQTISGIDVSDLSDGTLTLTITLTDGVGNESGPKTDTVVKDTQEPEITNVTVPVSATYTVGDVFSFTVNTSKNVTVNTGGGTPYLELTIGGKTGVANYLAGSGTGALVFSYEVQTGDIDLDGIDLGVAVIADGGTLRDGSGNNLNLTLNSIGSTAGVLIDALAPTVQGFSPADLATDIVLQPTLSLTFDEEVALGSSGVLVLYDGGTVLKTLNLAVAEDREAISLSPDKLSLSLDLGLTLPLNTSISVGISGGFVKDGNGNDFEGFSEGSNTWVFTTINKMNQSITFPEIASKTYGDPVFVLGDAQTDQGLEITYTSSDPTLISISGNEATVLKSGTVTITATQEGNETYFAADPVQRTLEIGKKDLTISVENNTKVYGDANPALIFSYSGLVNGDTGVDIEPGISTTATAGSGVGTYPIILAGGSDDNYEITLESGELEVTPAPLDIIAVPGQYKIRGTADPELAYTVSGLATGDETSIISGRLDREAGETVGFYPISLGSLAAGANYTIAFTSADFEIQSAELAEVIDPADMETAWAVQPELPGTVLVMTEDGRFMEIPVAWDTAGLNLMARGEYTLAGELLLPEGLTNPQSLEARLPLTVLAKPAPLDIVLGNNTFEADAKRGTVEVGPLDVQDPVDDVHHIELVPGAASNAFFGISGGMLYWNSNDAVAGKSDFTVTIRATDRDGNVLEKNFSVTRLRKSLKEIEIYNTFTPNGDGDNDMWGVPDMRFFRGGRVHVFERSGKRVFYTEDPDEKWDGTYMGRELPAGIYYWTVEVLETGEKRRGILTLLKQ
ncbi:DUF4347 domain-containing protein [Negadavirga shengliensis]|uniref:DUF4347 domain-containing protein n=1 Tax=Negadavirga shengliensis TaxID=1389218 RepID=A0ABV9T8B4_9BACT